MSHIDVRRIAIVVGIPREIRRGEGGVIHSRRRANAVIDGYLG